MYLVRLRPSSLSRSRPPVYQSRGSLHGRDFALQRTGADNFIVWLLTAASNACCYGLHQIYFPCASFFQGLNSFADIMQLKSYDLARGRAKHEVGVFLV